VVTTRLSRNAGGLEEAFSPHEPSTFRVPRVATAVLFIGTVTRDDLKQCTPPFAGDDASDLWNEK
jgi:hypothetical protein